MVRGAALDLPQLTSRDVISQTRPIGLLRKEFISQRLVLFYLVFSPGRHQLAHLTILTFVSVKPVKDQQKAGLQELQRSAYGSMEGNLGFDPVHANRAIRLTTNFDSAALTGMRRSTVG
ncbi:hypothetical protein N7478_010220 [Penicillium angulare]|uniref:uncharacterized protein n=1 Tax=Penicillium angulare TaxID=116970 RepID=UPI0025412C41|nr:uncharacterized protein N7478_010220 [Penicillium angulare]KAJ5267412.1 hypothetical protein N7478_010220 [Penicillium angulare]